MTHNDEPAEHPRRGTGEHEPISEEELLLWRLHEARADLEAKEQAVRERES